MLKVTFCVYDKPDSVGGPVTWVQRLLPSLRDHGIESKCLFLLHWGDTGPALTALRGQGFECRAVLAQERTQDRVRWILEQLRDDPPDIFVPNLVVAGYYAGRRLRRSGIPTVGILHSDDDYYRAIQSEFVFGPAPQRVSALVCVSRELERQVLEARPRDTMVRRIPYGDPIPSKTVTRRDGVLRIAYVGRLSEEQKRISDVARAFCRVVREIPGTEATIYGDGAERDSVERILRAEGEGLPVTMGGTIDSNVIQERLLGTDVIVLLSDYEGLPIALLEAMACGSVPVCLRMRSGIPELIEDGVTGLVVSDRGNDFVTAIRRLCEDDSLWERLSRAARKRVETGFSNADCATRWATMLREVHGHGRPRRPIRVPGRVTLPRLNPFLESKEQRAAPPSLPVRLFNRGRMVGGKIKRTILGRDAS